MSSSWFARLVHCVLAIGCIELLFSCGNDSTSGEPEAPPTSMDGGIWNKRDFGIPWNTSVAYGTVTDLRDSQVYRTVKIGSQTWFAENLNYKLPGADSGLCYKNSLDSCAKYGRMYTWSMVMGVSSRYDSAVLGSPLPHQGICPSGWRVPSDTDWWNLMETVGVDSARIKLSAAGGWSTKYYTGTDNGFRALAGGLCYLPASYLGVGQHGYFLTSSEDSAETAWNWTFDFGSSRITHSERGGKSIPVSLRCIKN